MTDSGSGGGGFVGPNFVGEIEKYLNGEYWVNRYFLAVPTLNDAVTSLQVIMQAEQKVLAQAVSITKLSARSTAPGDEIYATVPINLQGLLAGTATDLLPLFNVVRVDFQATVGRPSRKYLRGVLEEAMTQGMRITDGTRTYIQDNYVTPLVTMAGYVDIDGHELISGSVVREVAMRQLRRGSKKKPVPSSAGTL